MKTKKLVIIGIGETAHLAYEYFTFDSEYEVVAFAVENVFLKEKTFLNLPVFSFEDIDAFFSPATHHLFIALSSGKLSRERTRLYELTKHKGYSVASYVSSKAFVWHNVTIGENCFILENNTLQPFVRIGNNVTLWSGNHIGHRTTIDDNCFITSHVAVSGFCKIGKNCFIGVNAAVADNISIADDCLVSIGSVITKNTEENGIYKGAPAKKHPLPAKTFYNI